jgi:hypothetical protein
VLAAFSSQVPNRDLGGLRVAPHQPLSGFARLTDGALRVPRKARNAFSSYEMSAVRTIPAVQQSPNSCWHRALTKERHSSGNIVGLEISADTSGRRLLVLRLRDRASVAVTAATPRPRNSTTTGAKVLLIVTA